MKRSILKHRIRMTALLPAMALMAPGAAFAASEQSGLDACATAMTELLGNAQGSPVGYQVGRGSNYSSAPLRRTSTFYMDAVNPDTREVVARADCVISSNGQVIELKMLESDALSASHRARFGG